MAKAATAEVESTENTENVEAVQEEVLIIPEALSTNPILADFADRYLQVFAEINSYNKAVLAPRTDGWTNAKVLDKARELGNPDDANAEPVAEIKDALEKYEDLLDSLNAAKKALLESTAKTLGITLSNTSERDPAVEAPLKEKRTMAATLGNQMFKISEMLTDAKLGTAISEFLKQYQLPMVGRDQTRDLTVTEKATPKYRVTVEVFKDGALLLKEDGFTKTAQQLSKPVFGYERGQAPKADKLREAWEAGGNSADTTVSPITFESNGLQFVLTKK